VTLEAETAKSEMAEGAEDGGDGAYGGSGTGSQRRNEGTETNGINYFVFLSPFLRFSVVMIVPLPP
jgi:hypothetical protein